MSCKISIEFSSTVLQKQISAGAPFDLAILIPRIVDQLAAKAVTWTDGGAAGGQCLPCSKDAGVNIMEVCS